MGEGGDVLITDQFLSKSHICVQIVFVRVSNHQKIYFGSRGQVLVDFGELRHVDAASLRFAAVRLQSNGCANFLNRSISKCRVKYFEISRD